MLSFDLTGHIQIFYLSGLLVYSYNIYLVLLFILKFILKTYVKTFIVILFPRVKKKNKHQIIFNVIIKLAGSRFTKGKTMKTRI